MRGKSTAAGLLLLLLIGATVGWLERGRLESWYYLRGLSRASEAERGRWIERVAGLGDPMVEGLLDCLDGGDDRGFPERRRRPGPPRPHLGRERSAHGGPGQPLWPAVRPDEPGEPGGSAARHGRLVPRRTGGGRTGDGVRPAADRGRRQQGRRDAGRGSWS